VNDPVLKEIEQGWKLLNEGKEEEALRLATEIGKNEELSPEEKLKIQILRERIYFSLGNVEKVYEIAEETYREYEKRGNDFLFMDALNMKLWTLIFQGKTLSKVALSLIERGESIVKSISNRSRNEIGNKEVYFLYLKGIILFNQGKFDFALECCKKSLELIEQFNLDRQEGQKNKRLVVSIMGHLYTSKGDLNLALEYHKKSLALKIRDSRWELFNDMNDYFGMGNLFYLKGDLDKSLRLLKQSLAILEESNMLVNLAYSSGTLLLGIIRALIAKSDLKSIQHYFHLLKQINDENPIAQNLAIYNLLRARLLKSSTRSRDRTEAENIFKEIIAKDKQFSYLVNTALIEICDLYFKELKLTNDLTIIDEINPFISQLIEYAEKNNTYPIIARTKLLQARIALIQMNMGDARRFLTQAQEIADKNGYHHLAQTISIEHDNLLGQLGVWENLKKANAPLSERMNLASLSGSVEALLETQGKMIPEVVKEQPVLLLILMEGGVLLLSYQFADEWKSNDELFGSFLTAFMSFSNEFFTEGLDRAIFGQYTVLMKTISKYSICYLYKGQTYLAQKKLGYFIERLQNVPSIMQTLDKFYETSQVIELKDFPFLEGFITEIFTSKNPGNINTN